MHSGTSPRASVSSVKDPRYTGENRCIPCTVLNVGIAAVFSTAVIATLIPSGPTLAIGAGVGTFAVALALIYFRGYLVPGTPTITRLYFRSACWGASIRRPITPGGKTPIRGTSCSSSVWSSTIR